MLTPEDVREVASKLVAPGTPTAQKLKIVKELRDSIEVVHAALPEVLHGLVHVLETTSPQTEQNDDHKLRKSAIEVLHRVPHTTALRDHVPNLAVCLQNLALHDNQENAIVAMRVVLDLMRVFKPELEEAAVPLLTVFVKLYECWEEMYKFYFIDGVNEGLNTDSDAAFLEMMPSKRSFRVVAECPLAVLHLHQLYGDRIRAHVPPLVTLMVQALGVSSPSEAPPNLKQVYRDLKYAQVKTVAFLSHYGRQAEPLMQPYEQAICDSLVNLLKTCPDVVIWRKELLISTRTVLATKFKKTLNARLDDLKEEEALVGKSRECFEALRHYGYAVFAELAHQTKRTLKVEQLSWIVHRSCCIMHDSARPASSHSTAVRLLGNLVEVIHNYRTNSQVATQERCRELLRKILDCFVVKLNHVPEFPKLNAEVWNLLQNIFIGLRTVLYTLTTFSRGSPQQPNRETLKEEEVRLAVRILKGGLDCLKLCHNDMGGRAVELFADVFTMMDVWDFVEIMSAKIEYLYNCIQADKHLMPLVEHLLHKKNIGVYFMEILGTHLVDKRLEALAEPESEESQLILGLFELLFQKLVRSDIHSMESTEIKSVRFIATVIRMVERCLELIQEKPKPQGFLRLMWYLFNVLHKSKLHFAELVSLMQPTLDLFRSMLDGPDVGVKQDLIVQLCLLLPVELEKKYPVLPKLMKPLVMALKGRDEMVELGIQTLGEWVDRLNPEFLELAMSSVVEELNLALWSHLRPKPYAFGPKVLQLLGKLGGRNRRFLKDPLHLDCKENSEHGLRLILTFHPETKFLVPLDKCIALTRKGLDENAASSAGHNAIYYRRQALQFLHVCLAAMMNLYNHPDSPQVRIDPDSLKGLLKSPQVPQPTGRNPGKMEEQGKKTKSQLAAEKQTLVTLISSSIAACADPDLREGAEPFAKGICRHFALLFAVGLGTAPPPQNVFLELSAAGSHINPAMKNLDARLFLDAVVDVLSSDRMDQALMGEKALEWFMDMLLELYAAREGPDRTVEMGASSSSGMDSEKLDLAKQMGLPPVLDDLVPKVVDCCFGDEWQRRMGGMIAIRVMIAKLPQNYLLHVTPDMLHALLNVLKTLPPYSVAHRQSVKNMLQKLVQRALGMGDGDMAASVLLSDAQKKSQPVKHLVAKLASTVLSQYTPMTVRDYGHNCLEIVAKGFGKTVAEVVDPFVLATTHSVKSGLDEWKQTALKLRTVRHLHMEGVSRCLAYAIHLRLPSLEEMLKDIIEFVRNVVVICDLTEDTLRNRYGSRVYALQSFSQLRESGLELLVAVTDWGPFIDQEGMEEKTKILKLFFKNLDLPNDKMRAISKRGFANMIKRKHPMLHQKLPECLKPILSKINNYNNLDLQLLKGAADALESLSDLFNQEVLGEKLLDHLRRWIEPEQHLTPWQPEDSTKIAAALLNLFHLLPNSASTFLETLREHTQSQRIGLVVLTIELEDRLGRVSAGGPMPRVLWSPYRGPLTKFLTKYATEAVHYFLAPTRMQNSYFMRFTDIIKSEMGQPLLEELLKSTDQILALLKGDFLVRETRAGASRVPVMASIHALHLLRTLVKLRPDWLGGQRAIFDQLREMWHFPERLERLTREEELSQVEVTESKAIAKCILNYIKHHHDKVGPLVDIVSIFVYNTKVDYSFIQRFCSETVAKEYSHAERQAVLTHVFQRFMSGHLSEGHAVFALRLIVHPILTHLIEQKDMDRVVTVELVKFFVNMVKSKDNQSRVAERDVCLEVELLEVGKLLIIGVPQLVEDHCNKDLVKYAWNFLKCENLECKSHAFLLVAHILSTYSLSDVIMLQVFVNLLKSDFADTKRHLIREALDVLVPALVERFQAENEQDYPSWIKYARKHMLGEGHKLNLLVNLWQMVVRHPDLFYKFRSQFLPQMVNTLSRLRLPSNSNIENRKMAIDMARVIVEWEVKRTKSATNKRKLDEVGGSQMEAAGQEQGIEEPPQRRLKDNDGAPVGISGHLAVVESNPPAGPSASSSVPMMDEMFVNMTRVVVTFLAKMAFTVSDLRDEERRSLYQETMRVLTQALEIWNNVDFRLEFIEKLLEGAHSQGGDMTPVLVTGLDLVNVALEKQPATFLDHGWRQIYVLAQKVVLMRKEDLVNKLCSVLQKVYSAGVTSPQAKMVQDALERQPLTKYLDPMMLGQQAPAGQYEVAACLRILSSATEVAPDTVLRFMTPLIKLLERYTSKDSAYRHQQQQMNQQGADQPRDGPNGQPAFGTVTFNVCQILRLCGPRIQRCNETDRKTFLMAMLFFISPERCSPLPKRAVFLEVLSVMEGWLKDPAGLTSDGLGVKEVIWALQRMSRLDAQGLVDVSVKKEFEESFLEMLYQLCTCAELSQEFRQEIFVHVEQTYLTGLRSSNPTIRKKFFDLYRRCIGSSLYLRLKYILQSQDWVHVASEFWLKQALDFLLAVLREDEPITLAPNSSQVIPVRPNAAMSDKMDMDETGMVGTSMDVKGEQSMLVQVKQEVQNDPPAPVKVENMDIDVAVNADAQDDADLSPLDRLLKEHAEFMKLTGGFCVTDLVQPLREYAHVDPQLAYHLWVMVFPIVWATLNKNNQSSLAIPVIKLLSKEYHLRQASARPNVVQALLEGLSLSQPQPKTPPELIKYLGKTYNAWHIAIPLLESHVVIFPDESRCFDALAELYRLVSETDVMYGLLKKRCKSDYTHAGLSLIQYGYWDKASEILGEACKKSKMEGMKAPMREEWVWTEEWIKCNRQLNRWEELYQYANGDNVALAADCAWRLPQPEWTSLRDWVQARKDQFPELSQYLLLNVYSALHNGEVVAANTHIHHAMQHCLQQWWQLPEVGVAPHGQLLQTFQQLVELCESTRALIELNPPTGMGPLRPEHSFASLKDILETWRLRTPNYWEPLSHWSDVLMWRHQIYSSIATTVNNMEPNTPHLNQLGFKDKAWSINQLAYVARKHGSYDVCIEIVNNMYNYSYMDVQEAFIKIVEQAKAYLAMPDDQQTGLSMLYSTNLEFFPHQGLQAEIFRLKGEFHQALKETEIANQCYATAVALNHQLPEAWLCWGSFCDELYEQNPSSTEKLEYAVGCYLQAIQLQQNGAARNMLPRCLQLLSFDETGTVASVFQGFELPSWIWLFYIPQLLVGLHRPEGKVYKPILMHIIADHPQSLYYYLRVFYMLSSRDVNFNKWTKPRQAESAQMQGQGTSQGQLPGTEGALTPTSEGQSGEDLSRGMSQTERQPELLKLEGAKELMDRLKQQLGPIATTLEQMLREIASKFMAKPEERLMAVVHALLTRCYKVPSSQTGLVPENLNLDLQGVCQAFPESRTSTAVQRELRESFVHHLNPEAEGFPRTLGELTARLKSWRNMLSAYLDEQIPPTLQLYKESPTLQEINLTGIEMPCQHTKSLDFVPDVPAYLEKIGSQVAIVRRQGTALRRLAFYRSDGHITHFILQTGQLFTQPASSDEHMMQLMRLMNRLLDKHPQCRSRSLNWFAPVIVPVWTQVRLVEEDPSYTTYVEAYEMNCTRYGREPDHPVLHFKKMITNTPNSTEASNMRYQAFMEISKFVNESVFSQFIYKILPSCNHLWVFKRQFCSQMALSSLLSLMLKIGGRVPGKILFTKSSGQVFQAEFWPLFDQKGLLQRNNETVPFRLTRNLANFFTPFGVEGIFITSMVVAAQAIKRRNSNIEACLAMFFRDELLAKSFKHKSRAQWTNEQLKAKVDKNVQMTLEQLQKVMPNIPVDTTNGPPELVNKGVRDLVECEAQNPYRLCWMEPTWHPWY